MILAGLVLLVLLSWTATALLARAGVPPFERSSSGLPGATSAFRSPAILGGVLAGALLGPTLLGRTAPSLHEDLFVGARAGREQAAAIAAERQAWGHAAVAVGADPLRIEQSLREDDAIASAERRWRVEAQDASTPQRLATVALAMLILLLANPRSTDDLRTYDELEPTSARRAALRVRHWADACSIGLWSAGVPAIFALLLLWWHGLLPSSAAALWSVAAVAIGAWALDAVDRRIADRVEPLGATLASSAASVATAAAALFAIAAAWSAFVRDRGGSIDDEAPIIALLLALSMVVGRAARPHPRYANFAARWLLPPLAALGVVRIELLHDAAPVLILLAMLFSGDGRSIGAFIGATVGGGRAALPAMRLCLPAAAAAPGQLALAAVGVQAMLLPGWIGLALIVGAAVVEASAGLRPRVDRVIRDLESPPDEEVPREPRRAPDREPGEASPTAKSGDGSGDAAGAGGGERARRRRRGEGRHPEEEGQDAEEEDS